MFANIRAVCKLICAKVNIKFLSFGEIKDELKMITDDKAVIEKGPEESDMLLISFKNCITNSKRIPGIQKWDQIYMVKYINILVRMWNMIHQLLN